MCAHPAFFKVVRRGFVREDVDEEFSRLLEGAGDFGHEEFVIFHVFE